MAELEQGKLITVGWRERVCLPDWDIRGLRAKIDTGARTSAIDVAAIELLPDERVRFEVVTRRKPTVRSRWIEADLVRETVVKPSSGERQQRCVCRTRLRLGPVTRHIEVTLVCRRKMACRMLVGRTALAGAFVVDVAQRGLHPVPRRPREPPTTPAVP